MNVCLKLPSTWVPPLGYGMVYTLETRGLGNTNEYVVTIGKISNINVCNPPVFLSFTIFLHSPIVIHR